jgi:hypothetical protein
VCERKKTCDLDSMTKSWLSLLMMLTQNGVPKIANWTSFKREGGSSRVYLQPTFDVTFQDPWLNTTRKLCVCVSDTLFPCSIELCVFVCLSHSGGPKELVCVHCLDTRKTNPCAFHLFSSFKNALWQLPDCIEIYFFLVCNAIFSGFYRIAGRLSEMDGWCD